MIEPEKALLFAQQVTCTILDLAWTINHVFVALCGADILTAFLLCSSWFRNRNFEENAILSIFRERRKEARYISSNDEVYYANESSVSFEDYYIGLISSFPLMSSLLSFIKRILLPLVSYL